MTDIQDGHSEQSLSEVDAHLAWVGQSLEVILQFTVGEVHFTQRLMLSDNLLQQPEQHYMLLELAKVSHPSFHSRVKPAGRLSSMRESKRSSTRYLRLVLGNGKSSDEG